jgi:hypothetical protein
VNHGANVVQIDRDAAEFLRHATVARRANNLRHARAARDGPGQSMFATSRTKDQDFHCTSLPTTLIKTRKTMVGNGGGGSQTGDRLEISEKTIDSPVL